MHCIDTQVSEKYAEEVTTPGTFPGRSINALLNPMNDLSDRVGRDPAAKHVAFRVLTQDQTPPGSLARKLNGSMKSVPLAQWQLSNRESRKPSTCAHDIGTATACLRPCSAMATAVR